MPGISIGRIESSGFDITGALFLAWVIEYIDSAVDVTMVTDAQFLARVIERKTHVKIIAM